MSGENGGENWKRLAGSLLSLSAPALALMLLLPAALPAQGVSMGGHYAAEGGHPHVMWSIELRSPEFGPVQLAATHAAIGNRHRPAVDRTDFTLLASPDWAVRPVLVGGLEASRRWVNTGSPCGGPDPACVKRWYTGGVFGVGLSADVAGGRFDVRYLRHPAAPTANGALIFLVGLDL